ncbi:MAG: SDR family oxidoreductase [Magnetococcales bacterium]|nr:SDR family oxidoreductase [Magnetococcales bacterium]
MGAEKSILIVGATSAIGRAVAWEFAAHGFNLQLTARDRERLTAEAAQIAQRHGVQVGCHTLDILAYQSHATFLDALPFLPAVTLCAVGWLGNPTDAEEYRRSAQRVMESNYLGPALLLAEIAHRYQQVGSGTLIGISSVAGERGRASNYVYGSAKAGLTAYLSGLRNRLYPHGIHVITVKPGLVDTPMTAGMALPRLLTAQPQQTARDIYRGFVQKKDVIYTLWIWRWLMGVVRCLPEHVFKKTRF